MAQKGGYTKEDCKREMRALAEKLWDQLECENCGDSAKEFPLFMCRKSECKRRNTTFCLDCGQSAHKRAQHSFAETEQHVVKVAKHSVDGSAMHEGHKKHQIAAKHELAKACDWHLVRVFAEVAVALPAIGPLLEQHGAIELFGEMVFPMLPNAFDFAGQALRELPAGMRGQGIVMCFELCFLAGQWALGYIDGKEFMRRVARSMVVAGVAWTAASVGGVVGAIIGGIAGPGGALAGMWIGQVLFGCAAGWVASEKFDEKWSTEGSAEHKALVEACKFFQYGGLDALETTTEGELRKRYLGFAKIHHPDRHDPHDKKAVEAATQKMAMLNTYYGILFARVRELNGGVVPVGEAAAGRGGKALAA